MKPLYLPTVSAAVAALAALAVPASAQQRAGTSGLRIMPPRTSNNFSWEHGQGFKGGHRSFSNVWVVEREVPVVVDKEVVREVAPTPSPSLDREGSAQTRKPYVIGASYASLPGSCMKLIEEGVSFYYCSGEWYRQVGEGRSATYRAVARKL